MADNIVSVAAGVLLGALGGVFVFFGILCIGRYFIQKYGQ